MGAEIIGTGSYVPARRVSNLDLVELGVETSDDWIQRRVGIRQRFWASAEQATSDLGVEAARAALETAGVRAADLVLTICATSSPDYPLPATANLIQHRVGAGGGAYDLNGVCSGFVYALVTGFSLCETLQRPILVIGADTYSRWIDLRDRTSAIFFGDGAGAVVIAPCSEGGSLLSSAFFSDGASFDKIIVPLGGSRSPSTEPGLDRQRDAHIEMDGRAVWDFATAQVPIAVESVLTRAGLSIDQIDWLIPHQANQLMLAECARRIGISESRVILNVDQYGNTAAASIPIALDQAVRAGRVQANQNLVMVGFGGGLSWAAACLRWTR